MIEFRCWYCNRYFRRPESETHAAVDCRCGHSLRVPKWSWRSSKPWSFTNWLICAVAYGGGCGLLGMGFGFLLVLKAGPLAFSHPVGWAVAASPALVTGTLGMLFGERGANWVGRFLRDDAPAILSRTGSGGG
jgi:hypothetical protein